MARRKLVQRGFGLGCFGHGGLRPRPCFCLGCRDGLFGGACGFLGFGGEASGLFLVWARICSSMAATASAASAASAVTSPVKTGRSSSVPTRSPECIDRAGGLVDPRAKGRDLIGHVGQIDAGASVVPSVATCS
jgi:hypothetical protein